MRRISHDLPGVTQRIARLSDEYEVAIQETKEVWKDDKGRSFFQQRTSEAKPIINQLVAALTTQIELFEDIAKKVKDPDMY